MNYHAPAFNPFGCIERWEVVGGVLRVTVKEGPGALQLGAAAAVRKFADDAASAFISDMLRRYNDSEGARANSRFRDYRTRLEAEMAARFQKQNRLFKNGFVLLKVDRDGEIELNSRNGGRLVCQVEDPLADTVASRAGFRLVAGELDQFDDYLVAHTDTAVERFELSGLDIDADVIRDSLSRARAGVSLRLHMTTDGREANDEDFDVIRQFESDLHHTNYQHLIYEFEAAAGFFYGLLDPESRFEDEEKKKPVNLAGLWEKAVTNGGVIQGAYDWQRFLSEAPNPESPDAAREFSLRMRLCITDALLNRGNEIVLEPVVGSPPVLYELPMADFSITSTSWAIGNYQTPGLDAFFALIDMLTGAVTEPGMTASRTYEVPLHVVEDRFFEWFIGFHWSNAKAVGRTVWAVAFNDLADSLVAFGERVDMVGEKLWIPYRGDSPLASMFRIMLEAAPSELGGTARPLVVESPVWVRGRAINSAATRCSARGFASKTTDYLRVEGEVIRYLKSKLASTKKQVSKIVPLQETIIGILNSRSTHLMASALAQIMLSMNVYDKVRSDGGSKQRYTHALSITSAQIGDLANDILFKI